MGRTDEKREGMLQSFRLPSLCCYAPLWSLSYGQAFIRSTSSTVQTFQDSAYRVTHYDNS